MERRAFLRLLVTSVLAGTVYGAPVRAAGNGWKAEFQAALRKNPWLLGYQTVNRPSFAETRLTVEGTLPQDLKGTLFRNGSARHEIGDMRYRHWFDGDGMVHAFRFDGENVTHRARMVKTEKYRRELAAGKALVPGFGTDLPGFERLSSADEGNVASINIIKHNGELLALWEGGSAHRLDEASLETLGLKTWSKPTAGAPFGAHPRVDADGTLWNFGYAPTVDAIVIYRISAAGEVLDTGVIPAPGTPMIHDFVITERHLVLLLAPFRFDKGRTGAFLDRFAWRPEEGGRAWIVDKNNLTAIREMATPPMWVFHYANGYEDGAGLIHMQAPVYDSPAVMTETFREVMRGKLTADVDGARFMSITLDPAKESFTMEALESLNNSEFPRIDTRLQGRRQRYSYTIQGTRDFIGPNFDTVNRIDHDRGQVQSYRYAESEMAEEHVFVSRPGTTAEGDGWLVGTSLDIANGHSILNVFHADMLPDGPVARMLLPYALPLGLHGNFYG